MKQQISSARTKGKRTPAAPAAATAEPAAPLLGTKLLYTVREAARIIGCGPTKLYQRMNSGELESVKDGRSRRIPADALSEYVARLRGQTPAAA